MTDALKAIAENTANYAGGNAPTKRYADLLITKPADAVDGAQMAADVLRRAGIKVVTE